MTNSKPQLHPMLDAFRCPGGLFDVEPCQMDLNIGRRGIRTNLDEYKHGQIGKEPFEVVGVQKDYKGKKCYRICHDSDVQRFGCVLDPDDPFEWLTEQK